MLNNTPEALHSWVLYESFDSFFVCVFTLNCKQLSEKCLGVLKSEMCIRYTAWALWPVFTSTFCCRFSPLCHVATCWMPVCGAQERRGGWNRLIHSENIPQSLEGFLMWSCWFIQLYVLRDQRRCTQPIGLLCFFFPLFVVLDHGPVEQNHFAPIFLFFGFVHFGIFWPGYFCAGSNKAWHIWPFVRVRTSRSCIEHFGYLV